jgi:hypothetical protein
LNHHRQKENNVLKIDNQELIDGIVVYGDDERDNVNYVLPSNISFRMDDNGNPVFKYVKYRMPIDREDGKKGGGYVFFDVAFEVPQDKLDKIIKQKQAALDAKYGGGANVPKVEIAPITWTRGTANFLLSDSTGALIQKVNGAAKPSLYGKNVAAYALELTPEGATLFEQTMQGKGVGGVAVEYDLWFWARMPEITGRAWFYGHEFYSFFQEIDIDWDACGDDEYRETIREQFYSHESNGVEVNMAYAIPGDPEGTKKLADSIRGSLRQSLDEAIARKALKAIDPVSAEQREIPDDGYEKVVKDISVTKTVTIEESYRESDVFEWNVHPNGNVPNITTLKGGDGQAIKWSDYAIEVDLNDPFFKQLNVTVGVNADFAELPLHSVEVHLEYKEGQEHQIGEFRFTDPAAVEKFNTYIANDMWDYTWWYEVNYKGASKTFKSDPKKTNEKILTVNVDDLGILHVDIQPGDLNFDQVKSAQVSFEYEAGSGKVAEQFTLNSATPTASIKKPIFEPRAKPYRYKVKYFMADGKEYATDWVDGLTNSLFINDPFASNEVVNVRSVGDFQNKIEQIFIDLTYKDDTNEYEQTTSVALSGENPFFDWKFPVIAEGGKVSYSGLVKYKDGTTAEIAKTDALEPTILVGDVIAKKLTVTVVPDLIDFNLVKLVKVALRYGDEAQDFLFKAGSTAAATWEIDSKDKTALEYSWEAAYYLASGGDPEIKRGTSTEPTLVLSPPTGVAPVQPAPPAPAEPAAPAAPAAPAEPAEPAPAAPEPVVPTQ